MRSKLALYVIIFLTQGMLGQQPFYQSTIRGGVSFDARSYGLGFGFDALNPDTIIFQNNVPVGSTIKRAFLISRRQNYIVNVQPVHDNPIDMVFNGVSIRMDSSNAISPVSKCFSQMNPSWFDWQWISVKDVTPYALQSGNKLITPSQIWSLQNEPDWHYAHIGFGLLIIYEDNLMPATNVAVYLNSTSFTPARDYNLAGLNPVNTVKDAGLSVWLSTVVYGNIPDSVNYVLNSSLGSFDLGNIYPTFYTNDFHTLPGSFYYDNNTLNGLVDDTPDPFFDSTDALANIKGYLANNATTFTLVASGNVSSPGGCVDATNTIILAYSTPCPARSITPAQTYSLCSGQNVQLQTGAGTFYSWYPTGGLSDSTVSNPVTTPTATTTYIAYVDSAGCKHTEQFRVDVYPIPSIGSVSVTPVVCPDSLGSVSIVGVKGGHAPYNYSIGGSPQTSNSFSNVMIGTYTATVSDSLGCKTKTPFYIAQINNANASFTIQPDNFCFGTNTYITNSSGTVNNYSWYLNGTFITNNQYPNFNLPDTGNYLVTLIAYHGQPQCSDTVSHTLYVKDCPPDSFFISAPNIFTPNADGINDIWSPHIFEIGFSINTYQLAIYDRWGIKVFETSDAQRGWDGRTTSGIECVEGTYYFVLTYTAGSATAKKSGDLKGFLQLSR